MKLNLETRNSGTFILDPEWTESGWNLAYIMGAVGNSIETVDIVEEPEPKEQGQ